MRFRPFAIAPEAEAAGYGVELGLVHVCSELVMIETLSLGHGLEQHLSGRAVSFLGEPHLIAKMPDHELWMAFFKDTEGNTLALMSEKR